MDEEKKGYGTNYGTGVAEYTAGTGQGVDKGKLREQRNAVIKKFKTLAISQLIFGVVFLAVVIAQICVAAQGEYGHPLLNVGPWIISIMMIVGGAVGIQMWRKGEEYRDLEDAPSDLKKLLVGYWMINHMTNCSCIWWATTFCFMSVGVCASETSNQHKYCIPGKEANIALAAILGTFCLLSLVFIIPTYMLYFRNYQAFGIKKWCGNCCGTKGSRKGLL